MQKHPMLSLKPLFQATKILAINLEIMDYFFLCNACLLRLRSVDFDTIRFKLFPKSVGTQYGFNFLLMNHVYFHQNVIIAYTNSAHENGI